MTENFPKVITDGILMVQKTQRTPRRINTKIHTPCISYSNCKKNLKQRKIFKEGRGGKIIPCL